MAPEICPNCGGEVPPKAKACPECGSDEATGWSERAGAQRLDLPDDEFDYDEFVKEEFGEEKRAVRPRGVNWFWWLIALVVIVAFVWLMLMR
jgi:hypothetical protein